MLAIIDQEAEKARLPTGTAPRIEHWPHKTSTQTRVYALAWGIAGQRREAVKIPNPPGHAEEVLRIDEDDVHSGLAVGVVPTTS